MQRICRIYLCLNCTRHDVAYSSPLPTRSRMSNRCHTRWQRPLLLSLEFRCTRCTASGIFTPLGAAATTVTAADTASKYPLRWIFVPYPWIRVDMIQLFLFYSINRFAVTLKFEARTLFYKSATSIATQSNPFQWRNQSESEIRTTLICLVHVVACNCNTFNAGQLTNTTFPLINCAQYIHSNKREKQNY